METPGRCNSRPWVRQVTGDWYSMGLERGFGLQRAAGSGALGVEAGGGEHTGTS